MTVKELIIELEKIEDKNLDVIISSDYDGYVLAEEVMENEEYYGKDEGFGWSVCTRKCIAIILKKYWQNLN